MFLNFSNFFNFFLALEATITIAVVNCKTLFMHESSVMCNIEQFKMVDNSKMVMFFLKFRI